MYSTKTIEILEEAKREDKGITIILTSEINRKYFPVHLKFKDNTNYPFLNDTTHFSYNDVELEVDLQNNPPVVRTTIYPILEVKIKGFYTDPYFEQGSRRQPCCQEYFLAKKEYRYTKSPYNGKIASQQEIEYENFELLFQVLKKISKYVYLLIF